MTDYTDLVKRLREFHLALHRAGEAVGEPLGYTSVATKAADAIERLVRERDKWMGDFCELSQDDGKKDREIERLAAMVKVLEEALRDANVRTPFFIPALGNGGGCIACGDPNGHGGLMCPTMAPMALKESAK